MRVGWGGEDEGVMVCVYRLGRGGEGCHGISVLEGGFGMGFRGFFEWGGG
jgi:hypothetical protein